MLTGQIAISTEFYIAAGLVVIVVGISKSGFAGGLGLLAVPVMSLYIPPALALAIQMPILILIDVANCTRYWKHWSRTAVLRLLPGAILGLCAGALLFRSIDPNWLKALVGVIAITVSARYFLRGNVSAETRDWHRAAVTLAGFICGFAGFIAHAGGPAMKGYLLSLNLDKTTFVGTNSVFFLCLNLVKGGMYGALSQYSAQSLEISVALLPCLVVGVLLGYRLHKVISQRLFTLLAQGLLLLAGFRLLVDAVPGLL